MRAPAVGPGDSHCVVIDRPDDFEEWRDKARALVSAGAPPERIVWTLAEDGETDLFGTTSVMPGPQPGEVSRPVRGHPAFIRMAGDAILHRERSRFALLYRLLWRLQGDRHLMDKPTDGDVHRLAALAGHVRRDIHKMRAFVRFRIAHLPDGSERYVAWFEPDHHIVRRNSDFFLNRFASQRWSILTPDIGLHWDGERLTETPGADPRDAPAEDATEGLWQRYYAAIFNPARLKVDQMVKEMPRRYWKNLPEARLIPDLIAGAQGREAAMVANGADGFPDRPPATWDDIAAGIATCRRCAIGCNGTRPVPGEGPSQARLMIVGEQPGDTEERAGKPFVGPAGQVFDSHMQRAGLDRSKIRLTNAVKHFKFEQRGKRRIHQSPTAGEIDHCRWWLDSERRLVRPTAILALGASAGRAILGRTPSIANERGRPTLLPDGTQFWLTAHPSYLLRLKGDAQAREHEAFQHDLMAVLVSLATY